MFPAGSTSQIVNVTLSDDDILEPTKQYQVFIKAITVTGEKPIPPVILGDITVANGTILDDDGKLTACITLTVGQLHCRLHCDVQC